MTAAIFGIIGVVVGAVLNAGLTLMLERARQRAEARAAARLLIRELADCLTRVAAVERHGDPHALKDLPTSEWERQRSLAARVLTKPEHWHAVGTCSTAWGRWRPRTPRSTRRSVPVSGRWSRGRSGR